MPVKFNHILVIFVVIPFFPKKHIFLLIFPLSLKNFPQHICAAGLWCNNRSSLVSENDVISEEYFHYI